MAVDFFHRLIVRGRYEDVRTFRRQIYRQYPRSIGRQSWTEIVPFSFAALYEMAPAAHRIEPSVPGDPYELSAWRIRRINRSQAEVRYQFQTRNMELVCLIRVLSAVQPSLTFTLVTLCLDDSSIEVYRLKSGRTRKWVLPRRRRDFPWNRARIKFGLAGNDVYEDDDAENWAEEEMLHEALTHWDEDSAAAHSSQRSRYQWWNRLPLRDLATEQQLFVYEFAEKLRSKAPKNKSSASTSARRRKEKTKSRR
jgi:hypothetical protein